MKRLLKQLSAILLVFALIVSLTPTSVSAASIKVTKKNSGKVSTVLYPGARAKKATATIESALFKSDVEENGVLYDIYSVRITLVKANLSKRDVVGAVKDGLRKKVPASDYSPVLIDKNGNDVKNVVVDGGLKSYSTPRNIVARSGRKRYTIYEWSKTLVYTYGIAIPKDHDKVYIGFAGLRNGQMKKSIRNKYISNKINYYKAGFGSTKKGFIIAAPIN